ncbi:nucleotide-diphospho-sugar transferase [Amylocystis lapponica]|nr:nucleotide-diphospho-sugar transferase [Amylocystis lapponica]
MPPKSSTGKEKDLTDDDEVLQAVILADSFNKRFRPLTVGKPRCLLPICNATLLDWTFESLALAGVQEIFVICRSYADLVKAAIQESKWSKPNSGIKIVPIVTAKETFSPGDAMRDIYTHGIITSDFVLVMGDLVSNVRIDAVVRAHRERRRTNKDAIMTMVVKESGPAHRTRSKGDAGVFVLDANTSECLHYEPVTGYPHTTHAHIPREVLKEHPEVEIRNDLIDCSIDICSVEVPSLFQDNFDYADLRRDFVYGVLTSDLLMKNIYCYVAKEGYAARVADTRSYDAVSKDILSRWTFPLVPDDNHPGGHSYEHLRGNRYVAKGNSVTLSRTCKVGPNTLIGAHTSVGAHASVQASVIGQRCTIEPHAVLRGAYVGDDTHVGAHAHVEESIVGARVRIGAGSTVSAGCLVGDGVVLGVNARLDRFARVSRRRERPDADDDSDVEEVEANQGGVTTIVGDGSNAIVWPRGSADEDEDEDGVESFNNQRLMRIGDTASDLDLSDAGSATDPDSDTDTDSDTDSALSLHALSRTSSATSATHARRSPSPSALHALRAHAADSEFRSEVAQSLERAFAEGHSVENAAVELKTLRMASNVPLRRVREAVVAAVVERVPLVAGGAARQRAAIAQVVARWGALVDRIGGVDAVETVEVLQYHCAQSARLPLFGQLLAALYQDDIVEEDDIRAWHARPEARGEGLRPGALADGVEKCWAVGAKMIEQFDEQESEGEEASGDGSGEERGESEGEAALPTEAAVAPSANTQEPEESESEEESGEESDESELGPVEVPVKAAAAPKTSTGPTAAAGEGSQGGSGPSTVPPAVGKEEIKSEESGSEEESGDSEEGTTEDSEEGSEEERQPPKASAETRKAKTAAPVPKATAAVSDPSTKPTIPVEERQRVGEASATAGVGTESKESESEDEESEDESEEESEESE